MMRHPILFISLVACILVLLSDTCSGQLIISQYTETNSGSTPKGIELWNVSGGEVDFSVTPLDIEQGTNGGAPLSVFTLNAGTLADGHVLVVGTSDMGVTVEQGWTCGIFEEEPFQFNGDDALVIKISDIIVDVFGMPGEDPGSSWSGNGVSTANQNIKLLPGITTGDLDGWIDPSERFEMVDVGSVLTDFAIPPGGCTGPVCEITNLMVESAICNTITAGPGDTYDLTISYSGMDLEAVVIYTGSGIVVNGLDPGDLDGSDIVIETIPESEDWSITISGPDCDLDFSGFAPLCEPLPEVRINEVDCDQAGTDADEFIELYGSPGLSLDDFVVVLFNGNGDVAYAAIDLDGGSLDGSGYYVIGSATVPNVDTVVFTTNGLQNGADGVGLYFGRNAEDFPDGTSVNTHVENLIDGLVYDTDDPDDAGLLAVLDDEQINENGQAMAPTESVQRTSDGSTWCVAGPTPGAPNECAAMPVELLYFTAQAERGTVLLKWATSLEINHEVFALEHSINGIQFQKLGEVREGGKSGNIRTYAFEHPSPEPGLNYYRLVQYDTDGSSSVSPVRAIRIDANTSLRVYPNPVSRIATLEFGTQLTGELSLLHVNGKVVLEKDLDEISRIDLDISAQKQGLYVLFLKTSKGTYVRKLVKE